MKSIGMAGIALLMATIFSFSASAQMWPLTEGTQEIQVNGFMEWNGPKGDYTELKLGYGYFITEGVEVGPRFSMTNQGGPDSFGIDAYVENHYMAAENVAPYLGAALGYQTNSDADDSAAVALTISGGCKFFMVEDLALDLSLNHTQATGDVFFSDGNYESNTTNLSVGLRFFY